MKLLIASQNPKKLKEIREILDLPGLELVSALDLPGAPDIVEDGLTFEENAAKKALTMARASGLWALADDSGLEVDALNGAPGVHSARYAGEPMKYSANNRKLLTTLRGETNRRARFRCVLALASPQGEVRTVEGTCEGAIADGPRGRKGFGYDPLFVPEGHTVTFAEMDPAEKNRISHRGRALAAAQRAWAGLLRGA
jgi:XTP/dITP diphosphohydrolase